MRAGKEGTEKKKTKRMTEDRLVNTIQVFEKEEEEGEARNLKY